MSKPVPVYCETAELAMEATVASAALGLSCTVELSASPLDAAARDAAGGQISVGLQLTAPDPRTLAQVGATARSGEGRLVLGWVADGDGTVRGLGLDLGIACVVDLGAALAAAGLLLDRAERPTKVQTRKLNALDRLRLEGVGSASDKAAQKLVSVTAGVVGVQPPSGDVSLLGPGAHVRWAIEALHASTPCAPPPAPAPNAQRLAAAREVLFGPQRLLSDPASKAALSPYGLPMPQEELCSSPSRAAAEASRIGFPVRIALASPDLRVWDHPDLSVDGVDNAARVRDVYRQLMLVAEQRSSQSRVLGVTVTATTLARALIRIQARPLPEGRVLARIGFADPHGMIARDVTQTVLPAGPAAIERSLRRLKAHALLLGGPQVERDRSLTELSDLFAQIGEFVSDTRIEVERVDLNPVALLLGGGTEVREAAVQVTDAFTRGLS